MIYKKHTQFDWQTIIVYLILVLIGWLSIYSNCHTETNLLFQLPSEAAKQLIFIITSLIIGGVILLTDSKIIPKIGYLIYILCLLSLVLVLFIGKKVGGATSWFDFGFFGMQPAEFAKVGTILAIAKFMNEQKLYFNNLFSYNWNKFKSICIVILLIIAPILLIMLQPDAGSALVYGSLIIMFYREGFPSFVIGSILLIIFLSLLTIIIGLKSTSIILIILTILLSYILIKQRIKKSLYIMALFFFIAGSSVILSIHYSYEHILQDHQRTRIDILLGKEQDPFGAGFNLRQSLYAIGSGEFSGKGYLKGTQTQGKFVPEQTTDFIFCTVGEEFGFWGGFTTISLFSIFIIRIIILSERQTSRFSRIIGYCLASILFGHIFINIGMTIGIIPVVGIPLPFFSYGGSSMLAFSILLFIFLNLDSHRLERF